MFKLRYVFITLLFSLLFVSSAYGEQSDVSKSKNILIMFAQVPSTPAYRILLDGIRQKLDEKYGEAYNLYTEYLEVGHYPSENYPNERFELYNSKYRQIKLDLLICIGIDAIATIKDNASSQILNLPTVSIDFDLSGYGKNNIISLNGKTAVIGLRLNIGRTITEAIKLFPETSSIYFLCGISKADSLFMYMSQKEAEKIKSTKKVVFISNISMDEALRKVRHLPENSLLVLPSFTTDSRHVPYFNYESTRLISKVSNVPVITYSDIGFGAGALGGYFLSFEKVAGITGIDAIKILNGTDPKSLQVNEVDYYEQAYDWRELKRWHIEDSKLIPRENKIVFKEYNFIATYGWQLLLVLLFVILQTTLIVYLYRINRRQKDIMQQKAETERLQFELFREERLIRMAELTASLSHELNQPLTAILYSAQAGKRFLESEKLDTSKAKEIFDNIVEDSKRAGGVISIVRSLMKSETREKETFSLREAIQDAINIYNSEALQENIQIRYCVTGKPVWISGYKSELQQVLLNLLSNAFKAMRDTVVENKIIAINQHLSHGSVTVSVRDKGTGISDDIKDKLFKPFTTTYKSGLGIGLSISRAIIERHGGSIKAENREGGGAEFSFTLKVAENE